MRFRFQPKDVFTVFIIAVLVTAVAVSSQWVLRASIIILVLGTIGAVLATIQLLVDCLGRRPVTSVKVPTFELPSFDQADARTTFWSALEIWAWLLGVLAAIPLIGMPAALPLFVLVYIRVYGGSWMIALVLAALITAFIFGVYQQIMHVYWPDAVLVDLVFGN